MKNVISLESLFQERLFRVPDYQRGYSWGRQQVQDFLDDLDVLAPNRDHYTGTVVLHRPVTEKEIEDESGKSYVSVEIVDGQQRLTTTILLLDGIRRALNDINGEERPLSRGISQNYIAAKGDNGQLLHKLTLNTDTNHFFRASILAEHPGAEPERNTAESRLKAAQQQIKEHLDSKTKDAIDKEQWLRELHAKVTRRLAFTLFELEDEAEVGVIFEVMNDRGKPLTDLEKVKNYLLYLGRTLAIHNDLAQKVNDAWSVILQQLMAAGLTSSAAEDQLLRVHWLTHYEPAKKDWKGSKGVREKFDLRQNMNNQKDLLGALVRYTDTLRDSCFPLCDALSPQISGAFGAFADAGPSVRKQVVTWSERLRRVGALATFLPLLMAIRKRWPSDANKYLEIVKLCEAFAFRVYRLGEYRSDAGESALYRLAHDVARGAEDFEAAVARFKRELSWRCNDKHFESLIDIDNEQIAHAYGKRYLRYFLYEYESALAAKKSTDPKVSWEEVQKLDLKDTIEHILPQTIEGQDYWIARFGKHGKEQHMQYLHDLGNLTLTKWNAKYLNKPFPQKKGEQGGAIEFCYAKAPFFSEQELTDWEEWDSASIAKRRSQMLGWAQDRWRVDFGELADESPEVDPTDDEHEEDSDSVDVEETEV